MNNNQFSNNVTAFFAKSEDQRIRELNEAQSVKARLGSFIRAISVFLYPILAMWTGASAALFMGLAMWKMTNAFYMSVIAAICLAGVIEVMKLWAGGKTIHFFVYGWFKEGAHYIIMSIPVICLGCIAFGGSIYLAIKGSPMVTRLIAEQSTTLPLVSIDSIGRKYQSEIYDLNQRQQEAQRTTWRGKLTVGAIGLSKQLNKSKLQILNTRDREIQAAIDANQRTMADSELFKSDWGKWLSSLGGWAEGIQFLILVMVAMYYRYAYLEDQKSTTPDHSNPQIKAFSIPSSTSVPNPVSNHTPIGFKRYDSTMAIPETVPVLNAQTVFKQGQTEVIKHVNVNGEIKHYTRKQVENLINTYATREADATKKHPQLIGEKQEKSKRTIQNNRQWREYWENRLTEFTSQTHV